VIRRRGGLVQRGHDMYIYIWKCRRVATVCDSLEYYESVRICRWETNEVFSKLSRLFPCLMRFKCVPLESRFVLNVFI
jgi:hypothetical protein